MSAPVDKNPMWNDNPQGYLRRLLCAIHVQEQHRTGNLHDEVVVAPGVTGYCLDAPDLLPTGSSTVNDCRMVVAGVCYR
jgi:hypothetical protein